jgi:thiamine-monophosphate kinase
MGKQENQVIRKIRAALADEGRRSSVVFGIGDDAALWTPTARQKTILTCDWFLEGTHFVRGKHPADAVGWKCLARAVSDIAAMGGKPRCFLLSLALPTHLTGKWLSEFLRGLHRATRVLGCELAGGDTTRRDEVLLSVTVIGEVLERQELRRSGAKPGDGIYVSGILGEAEFGLRMLLRKTGKVSAANTALRKHLYPRPRLELGQWLAQEGLASSTMDLSDGLSSDLPRLCEASGVGASIDEDSLPVTSLAKHNDAIKLALHGGDDYELLFTVAKKKESQIPKSLRGLRLTRIGEITQKRMLLLKNNDKKTVALRSGGWDPFC